MNQQRKTQGHNLIIVSWFIAGLSNSVLKEFIAQASASDKSQITNRAKLCLSFFFTPDIARYHLAKSGAIHV